jgi:2'-5' RNA ligase
VAQSVELIVDPAAEAALRAQRERLSAAGLLSARSATSNPEQRPHITLYAADAIRPEVDEELPSLFTHLDLTVRIGPLMVFGRHADRLILVRAVAASPGLLDLQARTAQVCAADPAGQFGSGRWLPHVTLARRLSHDQLGPAVRAVGADADLRAAVRHCRRWDGARRTVRWLTEPA